MYVLLDPKSNVPIYEQIIRQVRERIVQGIVRPGEKVPSIRELSAELAINPNTVSKAYKELERLGIFVTYRGKGTFINEEIEHLSSEKDILKLKEVAKELVIDSIYNGIGLDKLMEWIEEYYLEMEGRSNDQGRGSNEENK
ncbi:GntR family transcriptional regulator [Salirhabdus sp. Marseille-P4669]|uniref:GntR family transcriptional regulator n=1 Tax=Salirhabdus sp. Marseille-P4669 TaxID=2042310 RepID=UPI000C796927|nr:GntR family transcriptional regulator [Salirhabdus sp. Marseille-P4669]